jgi:hypothetical protein
VAEVEAGVDILRTHARLRPLDRAVAGFLLILMVLGSLALWIGVPAAVLYGLSRVTDSTTSHYLGALVTVPLAMVACGALLFWINGLYMRVTGRAAIESHEDEPPQIKGPLGLILSTSLLIALVAMVAWLAMFGGQTPQGGAPPW